MKIKSHRRSNPINGRITMEIESHQRSSHIEYRAKSKIESHKISNPIEDRITMDRMQGFIAKWFYFDINIDYWPYNYIEYDIDFELQRKKITNSDIDIDFFSLRINLYFCLLKYHVLYVYNEIADMDVFIIVYMIIWWLNMGLMIVHESWFKTVGWKCEQLTAPSGTTMNQTILFLQSSTLQTCLPLLSSV